MQNKFLQFCRPTTLAALIADIRTTGYSNFVQQSILDDAEQMLISLVGADEANQMIIKEDEQN